MKTYLKIQVAIASRVIFPAFLLFISFASAPGLTSAGTPTPTATPMAMDNVSRVSCGNSQSYTDGGGNLWSADQAYTDGGFGYEGASSQPFSTAQAVAGTADQPLYQNMRRGNPASSFDYYFEVPTGTYRVALKFAEIGGAETGARVFSVAIQQWGSTTTVLPNFDIEAAAGGQHKAVDRVFYTATGGGWMRIIFTANPGSMAPQVNAIEVGRIYSMLATPTETPVVSAATPTAQPAPASSLGKAFVAPSPARAGETICLFTENTASSGTWTVYTLAGGRVASQSFGRSAGQCWDTSRVKPGIYLVEINLMNEGGSRNLRQKIALK